MRKLIIVFALFSIAFSPSTDPRVGRWAEEFSVNIIDAEETISSCELVDVFTTANGSWEILSFETETGAQLGQIPSWAPSDYERPEFTESSLDHHLFGAIVDSERETIKDEDFSFKFYKSDVEEYIQPINTISGWSSRAITETFEYVFQIGTLSEGPWCWRPSEGICEYSDVVCGGGLPQGRLFDDQGPGPIQNVSWFATWKIVAVGEPPESAGFRIYFPFVNTNN